MKPRNIIIGIIIFAVLGAAYYGISPIFMHTVVDEAAPDAPRDVPEEFSPGAAAEPAAPALPEESPQAAVEGTVGHPASGFARIVETDGKQYLRYEDFKTLNGPDLYVYLAKDLDAKEFVDLGRLKATEGNINYEIPAGIDLGEYRYALVWCRAFSVLFNSADLTP